MVNWGSFHAVWPEGKGSNSARQTLACAAGSFPDRVVLWLWQTALSGMGPDAWANISHALLLPPSVHNNYDISISKVLSQSSFNDERQGDCLFCGCLFFLDTCTVSCEINVM